MLCSMYTMQLPCCTTVNTQEKNKMETSEEMRKVPFTSVLASQVQLLARPVLSFLSILSVLSPLSVLPILSVLYFLSEMVAFV